MSETQAPTADTLRRIRELSQSQSLLGGVRVRDACTADEFRVDFAEASLPVLLRDHCANWPCTRWTLDRLSGQYGEISVSVRVGDYVSNAFSPNREFVEVRLRDYVSFLRGQSVEGLGTLETAHSPYPPYLGNNVLSAAMLQDLGSSPLIPSARRPPGMWLGPAGAVTPMHSDGVDNFVAQVMGHKRFILVPPDEYEKLAVVQWLGRNCLCLRTPVDPRSSAGSHDFRTAEVILNPGDVLYLPAGWFHFVESIDVSLMLNFFQDGQAVR